MITNTTTIRLEIEKGIRQKGHSLSSFGKQAGINRGIISGILNGNPPKSISIRQLDLMAEALGHAEGWMYEYYVDECFINEKADWRRIKAFLLRCTEIGRYDCIKEVLDRLMEDLNNTISIFGLAEELYAEGKVQESLPFYECVIENEKHQHSERLAISHYRVFRASIEEDSEKSFRAAVRFEPYRNRLPENLMLDALLKLANVYYTLQNWVIMEHCADELHSLSDAIYREYYQQNKVLDTERHLVVYYGQSYLLKSTALEYLGDYEEAKKYISKYSDLSWFEDLDEIGSKEVEKFKLFAIANYHNLNLLSGNNNDLADYVNFLDENPNEILPSMVTILLAANKNHFKIDDIIEHFSETIYQKHLFDSGYYHKSTYIIRYIDIYYQLAIYRLKQNTYNVGIEDILRSLELAVEISNKSKILECMLLFEQFRKFSNTDHQMTYDNIIKEANSNEKIFAFPGFNF